MKTPNHKALMFSVLLTWLLTTPTYSISHDHLLPCYNTFSGYGILRDYHIELRKQFFENTYLFSRHVLFIMLTIPSFEPEEMVIIYKYKKRYWVESFIANQSIWGYLVYKREGIKPTDGKIEPIKIRSYKANISMDVSELISQLNGKMVSAVCWEPPYRAMLDATSFLFFYGEGTCGRAISPRLESDAGQFVEIGRNLHKYVLEKENREELLQILRKSTVKLIEKLATKD